MFIPRFQVQTKHRGQRYAGRHQLDKYMGADYPAYARFFTPVQRGTMTPGRMVPDLLSFYLMAQFPPREEHKELIYA